MDRIALVTGCALALGLAACGGAVAPRRAHSETLAAVSAAEGAGATASPEAEYHLQLAREGLARAEDQIQDGRMSEAELTLERAKADADVAVALAHEAAAQAEVERSRARIQQLRTGGL